MWNLMLTRFFNTIIKNHRVQIYKHWALSATVVKINGMCTNAFNVNLSPEDKEKILQVLNTKTAEDLQQYTITKKRAQILEMHREVNGPFESLDDLLQIRYMNNKCVYNFYKSIIYGKKKGGPKKMSSFIVTPQIIVTEHKNVDTVLGIYIGHDMISWSLLNRNCSVLQWSYQSFSQRKVKQDIHSLLQLAIPIARKLPKADRYLMQEIGGDVSRIQNHQVYLNFIQQSTMGAIILSYLTMLDSKFNDNTEFLANNIFILRQRVLRKIYGLVINNETISTQYMLQKLLQENDELLKTKEPKVLIGMELRNMYNSLSPVFQEQIGWSLLIALAFVELIVHKRTDMNLREAPQR